MKVALELPSMTHNKKNVVPFLLIERFKRHLTFKRFLRFRFGRSCRPREREREREREGGEKEREGRRKGTRERERKRERERVSRVRICTWNLNKSQLFSNFAQVIY